MTSLHAQIQREPALRALGRPLPVVAAADDDVCSSLSLFFWKVASQNPEAETTGVEYWNGTAES